MLLRQLIQAHRHVTAFPPDDTNHSQITWQQLDTTHQTKINTAEHRFPPGYMSPGLDVPEYFDLLTAMALSGLLYYPPPAATKNNSPIH